MTRVVLAAARKLLPPKEQFDVSDPLPDELKVLWNAPVPSAQPHA